MRPAQPVFRRLSVTRILLSVSQILLSVSPERDFRYPNPAFSPALGRIQHSVTRIRFPLPESHFR